MKIDFWKYQGTGNDFVIVDNRDLLFPTDIAVISKICNRKFGVGADGLILLQNHKELDFEMIYYNSDGTASMCGNGGRCIVALAYLINLITDSCQFMAIDGKHEAKVLQNGIISLKMGNVSQIELTENYGFIETGSPHYVLETNNLDDLNIITEAHKIRYNTRFEEKGTNVNFIEKNKEELKMRTYERGVENETLSCGTGTTAVAIYAYLKKLINDNSFIKINTRGGKLSVSFEENERKFTNIWLTGPTKNSYKGQIEI